MHAPAVVAIFVAVYLGMLLGGFPRLLIDRTGIALLPAIAMLAIAGMDVRAAAGAVDLPTVLLLFALMVVSAQLRLGGFYAWTAGRLTGLAGGPVAILAVLTGAAGALSAVFSNDIVCLAMTPVVIQAARRRSLDPVPFLLALACASNVGSAATLIGNPQNMLIGQVLRLDFGAYLATALAPTLLGLVAVWALIAAGSRGRWRAAAADPPSPSTPAPPFDLWQSVKGLAVAAALFVVFLWGAWPREVTALGGAGLLLLSRRMHTRETLGLVDWPLLVLFAGLFVVNAALESTGLVARALGTLATAGVEPTHPAWLFALSVPLSNLVSNVPAVMLLLPAATHPAAGPALALSSTLAGNLIAVGSIANLIVIESAAREGVAIGWRRHARTGVPVTLVTLAIAGAWLALVVR